MGQKEEGIGAWEKEWDGIAVPKGFYPYKSEALNEALLDEVGFFYDISLNRFSHPLHEEDHQYHLQRKKPRQKRK